MYDKHQVKKGIGMRYLAYFYLGHSPHPSNQAKGIQWQCHHVRECPSSASIPTNPDQAQHTLPQSQHETSDSTLKTVGTAIPEHCRKLYQLWETVTVLTFLFRLCHLYLLYKSAAFTRIDSVFFSQVNPCKGKHPVTMSLAEC